MDTVTCDITALNYWRVPPVVQLLACSPAADARLARVLTDEDLDALSKSFADTQKAFKLKHCGNAGRDYRALMDVAPLLALCGGAPFDILTTSKGELCASKLVRPRLWSFALVPGSTRQVAEDLRVASPEFALQQVAATSSLGRALMMATELCGSYATYHTSAPLAGIIQRLCAAGQLPAIGGWSPCLDADGKLTDLWAREPITTPGELLRQATMSDSARGRKKLERVAKLVVADAASPFEAKAGILLGLPCRYGGAGLGGLAHNQRIGLTPDAALIAERSACFCDLYWPEGIDLECHSKAWHSRRDEQLSDFTRQAALELMGIEVVPMTNDQLTSRRQFDAIARLVAGKLGREMRKKSDAERRAEAKLRKEVLEFEWQVAPAGRPKKISGFKSGTGK